MNRYQLYLGDCMHVLPALPNASVDAIITDPPYGVFSRELKYDQLPNPEVWHECYRVAKPNAWLAAFGQMPTLATMHQHILSAGWRLGRQFVGIEIESEFFTLAQNRIAESRQQTESNNDPSNAQ